MKILLLKTGGTIESNLLNGKAYLDENKFNYLKNENIDIKSFSLKHSSNNVIYDYILLFNKT